MNKFTIAALTALVLIAAGTANWLLSSTTEPQNELPSTNTHPKQITNVTLGIITDSDEDKIKFEFIANYAISEVNEYAVKQGNFTRFKYISEHADDIWAANELGKLREENVTVFLGFDVSEAMCASLSYARSNGVILLGIPEVHHPSSALPGDEMFRISPNLREITYATQSLIHESGAEGILFIYWYQGWGDEIFFNLAEGRPQISEYPPTYEGLLSVRYTVDELNFTAIVRSAESKIAPLIDRYGANKTVVVMIGGDEWLDIFKESAGRKGLCEVTWIVLEQSEDPYTSEGDLPDPARMQNIGVERTTVLSLKREPLLNNDKYELLQTTYAQEYPAAEAPLGVDDASFYDSVWVACLSVLKANSTDGRVLRDVIPSVALKYSGASGRIVFDVNGDRSVEYYIYEAVDVGGVVGWVRVGSYDAITLKTSLELD